ncbi:MAG: UvrD-helicase domain-containing protein [Oscillospiraceae bacterium]|jgi:ATP-dependent helicase/nuclease subunit A|nr:UvrD-helicase domain-containing protein [Oscillospiraceae bacterium]
MNFTEQQLSAIEYSGSKLLISAAAGSGKTRVLVERILRKVEAGASIRQFLIITYTNAAAAELRSRIVGAFAERIAAASGERERKYLRSQMSEAYQAQITTIDSFCQRILREYAYAAGIRSDFRVMDESEARDLQLKILDDLLESKYDNSDNGDSGFTELVDAFSSGRDDSKLVDSVIDTYGKLQSLPYPKKWLEQHIEQSRLSVGIEESVWGRYLLERTKTITEYEIGQMEYAIQLIKGDAKAEAAYEDGFIDTLGGLYSLSAAIDKGWDTAYAACGNIPFAVKPLRGASSEAKLAKEIRDDVKKSVEHRLPEQYFTASASEMLEDMAAIRPSEQAFYSLVLSFIELYDSEKRTRGALDFSDLEHIALNLLWNDEQGCATAIAAELASKFIEILVDEFQDINGVQDLIFKSLNASAGFAAVGDVKQSIYRFRRADPSIFLRYYHGVDMDKVLLPHNFRSAPAILEHVNRVFSNIMSPKLGDMEYGSAEYLRSGIADNSEDSGENSGEAVQFVQLTVTDGERLEQEARYVASLIKSMLASGEYTPNDFAILLRSPRGRADFYVNALRNLNIPASSSKTESFFERPDVAALLSILEVIDNPLQDIPLIAALKLFGFSKNDIGEVREFNQKLPYSAAFRELCTQQSKFSEFAAVLKTLRELSSELPVDELLRRLNEMTDIIALFSTFTPDAQSVFFKLLEYAKSFESNGYKGLYSFLVRLNMLKAAGKAPIDIKSAAAGTEVTVTSIHGSKGLEYPVVILADTAIAFNHQDERVPLLFHEQFGAGPKLIDHKRKITYPTLPRLAIRQKLSEETLSEEMRVLYVAMTRAKERLIMIHSTRKFDTQKPLRLPVPPERLRRANSVGEWLELICADSAIQAIPPEPFSESALPAENSTHSAAARIHAAKYSGHVPSKITASELKGSFRTVEASEEAEQIAVVSDAPARDFRRPDFIITAAQSLTASERGTALHLAMQNLDFSAVSAHGTLTQEIERLKRSEVLTPLQADSVLRDISRIQSFFASPLGQTVLRSENVHRELKFSLLVSAKELHIGGGEDKVLLQGVADLCIEDSDTLTLVDYKTDYVTNDTIAARAEYYRGQLYAYTLALSRIFGKPVKECILYFFALNRLVSVTAGGGEWDL